ncbi:GFA family protein [Aestuariivirga sp.]|uniref:GFA family protein n=1 Tax=Aestuariivirga sp. TaxID=2650926 RepID=UPI0039E26249
MITGSCLCGGVAFEISGPLRPVIACHCSQCRKQSGHYAAFTSCQNADLTFTSESTLAWYRASASAGRGFCKACGSLLFWKADGRDSTSVAAGSLNGKTGLVTEGHIYCADKGDYYAICDGEYHLAQW